MAVHIFKREYEEVDSQDSSDSEGPSMTGINEAGSALCRVPDKSKCPVKSEPSENDGSITGNSGVSSAFCANPEELKNTIKSEPSDDELTTGSNKASNGLCLIPIILKCKMKSEPSDNEGSVTENCGASSGCRASCLISDKSNVSIKQEVGITDLPAEIFQHVLRYLTFDNIAKVRLVSRYFNGMCSSLLNSEFNKLRVLVQQRFMAIKAQMPRRESSRRKHPLARESDIIETLYMRLTLLNMTFGKHIERKYCCFFAGEIIDEIYKILQYVQNTPSLSRAYKVTDELFDLSTMAMEYFKEHIEPSLPEVTYFASDVFEYPTFSSVKAHHSMIEETVTSSSDTYQSSNCPLQNLNKRLKLISKKVNRNSKDVANLKRSAKLMSQKINSLSAIVSQMKKEENCDTTILPYKINDSHKINKILSQLNMCKEEIEDLTSKLAVCSSDRETKNDWESLDSNVSSVHNFGCLENSGGSMASSESDSYLLNPKLSRHPSEMKMNNELYMLNSTSLLSTFRNSLKRKLPSSTVTKMNEWSEPKRKCTDAEECASVKKEKTNSK